MKKTAPPIIVQIDRVKLSLCSPSRLEPLNFPYTPTMISDLEIINSQELHLGLREFVNFNKIKPGPIVLILASAVYFEKNYNTTNPPTTEKMEEFSNSIPFSATSSKLFRVISGFKQVVINRDFYENLKTAFEEIGFQIVAVVPAFALGQNVSPQFTAETCRSIYKKIDQIIADSIISSKDVTSPSFQQQEKVLLEGHKPLIIALVFLVLLICAGALYFALGRPPPQKRIIVSSPQVLTPTPTPFSPPVEVPATPSAEILGGFTVQILNSSGVPGQANSLSAKLKDLGFTKIQTGNYPSTSENTIISSPRAATFAGQLIGGLLKASNLDYSLESTTEAKFDITVILGKITP